jgi:hypothetical protein
MDTLNMAASGVASDERLMYRVGGIASIAIGVAYVIIVGLYASVGVPPVGGEAWMNYLAGKTAAWWAIVGISVLTNFLFVLVTLALYFALCHINRVAMLIGVAFVGLFVILESAVNWPSLAALIKLSTEYAAATNDSQRAIFIAAANYPSAVIASPLAPVYAIGTLSFAFLVIGIVMLKGVFSKLTAYMGILTGMLGLVAVAGLNMAVILNAVAATVWLFFVGFRLYRLAGQ